MMSIYELIKYRISKQDLFDLKINQCGNLVATWTPYLKKVISEILDYLEILPSEFTEPQMFISGQMDICSQSDFNRQSHACKIGAKATTEAAGYIILLLMRMIIDGDPGVFPHTASCPYLNNEQELWTIKQLARMLEYSEREDAIFCPVSGEARIEVWGVNYQVIEILKRADQIDLWDIQRVRIELSEIPV